MSIVIAQDTQVHSEAGHMFRSLPLILTLVVGLGLVEYAYPQESQAAQGQALPQLTRERSEQVSRDAHRHRRNGTKSRFVCSPRSCPFSFIPILFKIHNFVIDNMYS